jgi:hypothetical protein
MMPLGLEVIRGFKKLLASDSKFASGMTTKMLNDEESRIIPESGGATIQHF